jgi:hypothetical protein
LLKGEAIVMKDAFVNGKNAERVDYLMLSILELEIGDFYRLKLTIF